MEFGSRKISILDKKITKLGVHQAHGSSGSGGGQGRHTPPPGPVKISHKKMAVEGGSIDFMFFAPLTWPLDPLLHGLRECSQGVQRTRLNFEQKLS